jgi:hypothetical protein
MGGGSAVLAWSSSRPSGPFFLSSLRFHFLGKYDQRTSKILKDQKKFAAMILQDIAPAGKSYKNKNLQLECDGEDYK